MKRSRRGLRCLFRIRFSFFITFLIGVTLTAAAHFVVLPAYRSKIAEIERLDRTALELRSNPLLGPSEWLSAERQRAFAELELYFYCLVVFIPLSFVVVAIILIFNSREQDNHHTSKQMDKEALERNAALRQKVRSHFAKRGMLD